MEALFWKVLVPAAVKVTFPRVFVFVRDPLIVWAEVPLKVVVPEDLVKVPLLVKLPLIERLVVDTTVAPDPTVRLVVLALIAIVLVPVPVIVRLLNALVPVIVPVAVVVPPEKITSPLLWVKVALLV